MNVDTLELNFIIKMYFQLVGLWECIENDFYYENLLANDFDYWNSLTNVRNGNDFDYKNELEIIFTLKIIGQWFWL